MPGSKKPASGAGPDPQVTYTNPRRTSPENSITLRHHRLAQENSKRFSPTVIPGAHSSARRAHVQSPRRNSSGESNETGRSDPRKWFDRSNKNAQAAIDTSAMDVDPPFYQRETDSSNEDSHNVVPTQSPAYRYVQDRGPTFRPGLMTQSSSAGDYRSVIDDLTVENKRLREELRKYKQRGPDSLRRDQLFEVKVHGLPNSKKRELEAALRDFTTRLDKSSPGTSTGQKKSSRKSKEGHSSTSKHPSSSSGSNSRPVDSAYASMSTGANASSSSQSHLAGDNKAARLRNNQNVENYLRDIPEGLWPRQAILPEKDKKKLVVRRLEQLFTGKASSLQQPSYLKQSVPAVEEEDTEMQSANNDVALTNEAAREAQIRPREAGRKTCHTRDTGSGSNEHSQSRSHGETSNDNDNGSGSGSGSNTSPPIEANLPEQRPTRPRDLDPDRRQVPMENMDYIRHLGLVAPETQSKFSSRDVSPDAEGWVYLNLLCNLAQLHILNVTPDFIRSAVSEKSTKFQLSPDGRRIRWRGGDEGTKFASDSSGSSSQRTEDTDGSNALDQRKKQKTRPFANDAAAPKPSRFRLGVHDSNSSESFHYKPLFVHHNTSSSEEQPSAGDETGSSWDLAEESNMGGNSRWNQSGISMGQSQRKRRRDGAIIYYSGAPFCTDLSGDVGEVSADTDDMTSSLDQGFGLNLPIRPYISRTTSGSSIPFRPLSDPDSYAARFGHDTPDMTSGETEEDDDIDADFVWSDQDQQAKLTNLEASGLGGIYPADHFVVVVSTNRPKKATWPMDDDSSDCNEDMMQRPRDMHRCSQDSTDSRTTTDTLTGKLADMSTESPVPLQTQKKKKAAPTVEIDYINGRVRRLPPVPLPPPAFYFPSNGFDTDSEDDMSDDEAYVSSERSVLSKRPMIQGSDNQELSGNDEEDEISDDVGVSPAGARKMSGIQPDQVPPMRPLSKMTTGSSAATAGDAASGYNSSMEDVEEGTR